MRLRDVNFASDNWAGATPEVMAALNRANEGFSPAYGGDALTAKVRDRFAEVFEHEVEVWFVGTGTAANSMGLSGLTVPGGVVFAGAEAHVNADESNAFEFQSGGMKIVGLPSPDGRLVASDLAAALTRHNDGGRTVPVALSLTNATEWGTVYSPAQVAELSAVAKTRGMAVHVDGARFGNAVAATGATPAELTWKSGADFMSFGATKNGAWAAEAIVAFKPGLFPGMEQRRQRAGHVFSKARFVAAQFEGYFEGGAWLKRAAHANAMAERLRAGLRQSNRARLAWESDINEVFAVVPVEVLAAVRAAGGMMHEWPAETADVSRRPGPGEVMVRMVTSWASTSEEVDRFLALL
jgi:threonine aldolase